MNNSVISYADPTDAQKGNILEFYQPWETYNPHFGRPYLEVYDKNLKGKALQDMLAADTLHYLGAAQPNGIPVDPAWSIMKKNFARAMSPAAEKINKSEYADEQKNGEKRTFDEWMQQSRIDAYLRGALFPDINPEWQREGLYSTKQKDIIDSMRKYISQ